MTPERWRQITGLFHAALDRDAVERDAFVASRCGSDEGLRREVAAMLEARAEAGRFDDTPGLAGPRMREVESSQNLVVLTAGCRFGPYRVMDLIGVGGMGAVYRARDTRLQRDVALKVLLPSAGEQPDRLARFSREARVLASLNHPNISQAFGLEEAAPSTSPQQDGVVALVMELVEGPTLADRIAHGALPMDEALTIAGQIASALEAAHEHGIIHRDLKPANVKVRADGTVKVLDFGLAKALGTAMEDEPVSAAAEGTLPGVLLGTACYMAPEQAKGKPVDRRADMWAFGCVLFEMLSGDRAFTGETLADVLVKVIEHEPHWQTLPTTTPSSIQRLLHRCLHKDPKRRLDSAAVARLEIDEAAREPASLLQSAGSRRGATWRTLAWAAAGAGAALLATMLPANRGGTLEPPRPLVTTSVFVDAALNLGQPGVHFAVAPDGRTVVLAGLYDGLPVLLRRDLDQLEAEPIVGTAGASDVFFSPDGRWLGFETRSELWTASLGGGTPQRLLPNQPLRGGTWGAGGRIVFGRVGSGLWMASATGGEPRQLTHPAQGERHELPQMLPGDRAVLFTILASTGPPRVVVLLLGTGEIRPLFEGVGARFVGSGHVVFGRQGKLWAVAFDPDSLDTHGSPRPVRDDILWSTAGYPQFTAEGGLLTYVRATDPSGSVRGKSAMTWVDRQGRKDPLPFEPDNFMLGRLSPTGDRLVVQVGAANDLWIYHLGRGNRARLTSDRILAYSAPIWTPDGSRVVFTTWFDGDVGLGWLPADGSGPVEALFRGAGLRSFERTNPVMLPDGSGVVLTGLAPGATVEDLLFVRLTGDRRVEPLFQAGGVERQAAIAPSGRFIAYNSDESGHAEVYVRPFPEVASRKWLISTQGGAGPVWTRGGTEIVYKGSDGRMMAVAVESDGGDELRFSRPVALFESGVPCCLNLDRGWDVTADGERFLVFEPVGGADERSPVTEFVLVQNWADELTRVVPREP